MTYQKSLFTFISILLLSSLNAQTDRYAKVSITINSHADIHTLDELGLELDHYHRHGDQIEIYIKHTDIKALRSTGFVFKTLIPDFESYYIERQIKDQTKIPLARKGKRTADNFDYGSMGGFYTLAEMEQELDNMRLLFPTIVSEKFSIGTSIEGRDIWAVRISDNADTDEAEPTVYYDAVHHAREPASMATMINYMYWLLENYSTDPQVSYIVNERESYFVPIVNPDGYEYNRQTNPNGGGFWRKNRRVNGFSSCRGVDLNRNYSYTYGADNVCSSTSTCSDTYRGSGPFSEPESQAIRDFVNVINPATSFTVHSYSGVYIFPDVVSPTPANFDVYTQWASDYAADNDYLYGSGFEMLGYTACGTTDSYLHSEGVFSVTPEMGFNGFWPPQSEIFALVDEHVSAYFYQAWVAGAYVDVKASRLIGDAIAGGSFQVEVDVKNKGLNQTATNVSIDLMPSDPSISIGAPSSIGTIPAQMIANNNGNPLTVSIPASFAANQFDLEIISFQNGVENTREVITVYVGVATNLLEETADAGISNWTNSSGSGKFWTACGDDAYNGDSSFCDSDGTNSLDDTDRIFTLNQTLDLTTTTRPRLSYFAKWSIEKNYDEASLEISTNGGASWTQLKTYEGNSAWVFESFDLQAYTTSTNVTFRFSMMTDGGLPGDGFYFDDFKVVDYTDAPIVTCNDLIQNGDETGVDCGGTQCPLCDCTGATRIINTIVADEQSKYSDYIISDVSGASISNAAMTELSAKNYIELYSNFEISIGSVVHLYIEDCQ